MIQITLLTLIFVFVNIQASTVFRDEFMCLCSELNYNECIINQSNCYWNKNEIMCKEQICSDLGSTECYQNKKCQYVDNTCKDFTSCESINGKSRWDCELKSINCLNSNGIVCLSKNYYKYCDQMDMQDYCFYSQEGECIWSLSEQKCVKWDTCNQASNSIQCKESDSCQWSDKQKSCLQKTCKDQTENYCYPLQTGPNSNLFDICKWNESAKICEIETLENLDSNECYYYTIQTHHWNSQSKYCQLCIPNALKPVAKYCDCTQLQIEGDCIQNLSCFWKNENCQTKDCSDITSHQACLQQESCAWYQNVCADFKNCNNYQANFNLQCSSINSKCILDSTPNICTSKYIACDNYKNESDCNGSKSSSKQLCYWDINLQKCSNWTNCQQQQSPTYCEYSGACIWKNNNCKRISCSDLNEKNCSNYLVGPNSNEWKYCMLFLGDCEESDEKLLDEYECYSNSFQTSYWNKNACQQCRNTLETTVYTITILISLFM